MRIDMKISTIIWWNLAALGRVRRAMLDCLTVVGAVLLVLTTVAHAQSTRIDPRSPYVRSLPEVGRMEGTITHVAEETHPESFGNQIYPVGDVNNDGLQDFIVARDRADTAIPVLTTEYTRTPEELLLYLGVRDGLPTVESGERIGITEIATATTFLAAGDWDADGNRDIACRVEIINDTAAGNSVQNRYIATVVVFWGDGSGEFGVDDTTRLEGLAERWLGARNGVSGDLSGDGIDDLAFVASAGQTAGQVVPQPNMWIFRGGKGHKWGRDGTPRTTTWGWWTLPGPGYPHRVQLVDQDCDGANDLAFYFDSQSEHPGQMWVLYGRPGGGLPDTNDYQYLSFDTAGGKYGLLRDVTGDGTVDLILTTGIEERLQIFAGRPGERLDAIYGTGNEAPRPGETEWWGRPWAQILMPRSMHDGWAYTLEKIFDLGDSNLDSVADLWMVGGPYLLGYRCGRLIDSLIDVIETVPRADFTGMARLGDIDGSGVETIAIGYDDIPQRGWNLFPGGIKFIKPAVYPPVGAWPRPVPHVPGEHCGSSVSSVEQPPALPTAVAFTVTPNPAEEAIEVSWSVAASTTDLRVTLYSITGTELHEFAEHGASGRQRIATTDLPAGTYLVALSSGTTRLATRVVIVR